MLGAIIGDIVGSRFEFNNIKTKKFALVGKGTSMTDDSIMTVAVDECLFNGYENDPAKIVSTLKKWGRRYPNAGYGGRFYSWVLGNETKPYNSYGNGSAMRVSGAGWFGNTEAEVKKLARAVTEVTHNHPEGLKGAEVTAMCVYYARKGKSKSFIREYIYEQYPEVMTLDYEELRRTYAHEEEICQVTVPQALFCFYISESFEDCLRTTISIGGDCDTTAAISCAVAEAFYGGVPNEIFDKVVPYISDDVMRVLAACYTKVSGQKTGTVRVKLNLE